MYIQAYQYQLFFLLMVERKYVVKALQKNCINLPFIQLFLLALTLSDNSGIILATYSLMDVDDCLSREVGSFGRYQIFIYFVSGLYNIFAGPSINLVIVFIGADPASLLPDNPRVNNESSILTQWDLLDKPWLSDFSQSLFYGGFLFGVVLIGQASDKYGRRMCIVIGYGVLVPLCLLTSFSTSFQMFATLRCLSGFVLGGTTLVHFVYLQEIVGNSRWALTGSIQGLFFPFGIIFGVIAAYFLPAWRSLLQLITILQIPSWLLMLLFFPESPRWYYSKGDLASAKSVLCLMAKRNGMKNPVISLKPLMTDISKRSHTIFDVFRYKATAKRMMVMIYLWFCNSLVYYAFTLAAGNLGKSTYTSEVLSGVVEFPAYLLAFFLLNRRWCGRRLGVCTSLFLTGVSCLVLMAFDPNEATNGKLAFALVGKLGITFSFNGIYIYSPELFPTSVRNVALGALSMSARVGGIIASFSKSFITVHPLVAYGTYGTFGIAAGMLTLLLPETLGKKPPDSFDNFDASSLKSHENNPNNYILLSSALGKSVKEEKATLLQSDEEEAL